MEEAMVTTTFTPALVPLLRRIAFTYSVFVMLMLLMPFRVSGDPELIAANSKSIASLWFAESLFSASVVADMLQNLVLFAPLGFFCRAAGVGLGRVALAGFLLSLGAETTQLFMPGRCASLFDLVTNTLGAFFGAAAFRPLRAPLDWTLRFATRFFPVRLAPVFAAASLALALLCLFLKVCPTGGLRWEGPATVYLGSMPGDIFAWRGVLERIAFWGEAPASSGKEGIHSPAVDLDFRASGREELVSTLPADASWVKEGLLLGGSRVSMSPERAKAVCAALGAGGPFRIGVWCAPERLDFRQNGCIFGVGSDTWHEMAGVGQWGRDVSCFFRTTISGTAWDKPGLVARDAAGGGPDHEWHFDFDGATLRAIIDGSACCEVLSLRWWATPAGLLLASPAVVEPLTLYSALFLFCAFFAALWLPSGARGAVIFAAAALALPAAAVAVLTWLCGVPPEKYALLAVLLGGVCGGLLGRAWACAARAR
jgi:glycopeptide antibiotics resistance protein